MSQTYPIALVLADKAVLIVGGGEVATRKVKGLLECDAQVTVVAPCLTPELEHLAAQGCCVWCEKNYETSDLEGIMLVFACTNNREVNVQVSEEATQQHLLVNVADCPELCSFYLPSVLRRGMLSIAVSTEGSSPLTARRIRGNLEEQFDDAIATYLELLQSWRGRVMDSLSEENRHLFWHYASEGEVYEMVKDKRTAEAEAVLADRFNTLIKD